MPIIVRLHDHRVVLTEVEQVGHGKLEGQEPVAVLAHQAAVRHPRALGRPDHRRGPRRGQRDVQHHQKAAVDDRGGVNYKEKI